MYEHINSLTSKAAKAERADDAMKLSQAALNLSHALQIAQNARKGPELTGDDLYSLNMAMTVIQRDHGHMVSTVSTLRRIALWVEAFLKDK